MVARSVSESRSGATAREERNQIVLDNLALVRAIALRVHETLPVHVDLEDLVHAGVLGLFDAAERYDSRQEVSFQNYAKHRIKGSILDSLRESDWASRDMRKRHKQVEQATRDLSAALSRPPSETELAGKMGVTVERWRQMAVELRMVGLVSTTPKPSENDLPEADFPGRADLQPDRICERNQMGCALGQAMHTLPERYKKVVDLYYTAEMTMKEIGGVLGIKESRVSQIHKTALEKMAVALQTAGIRSATQLVSQ